MTDDDLSVNFGIKLSKEVMRRSRTTRHETQESAALFSFSMAFSDEIYIHIRVISFCGRATITRHWLSQSPGRKYACYWLTFDKEERRVTIRPAILQIVLGIPAGLLIAYIISRFSDNTPWDHDKLTGRQPEMLPPPPYPAEPPVYYILPERVYYVPQILVVSQVPEAIYGEDDGEELVQESSFVYDDETSTRYENNERNTQRGLYE